MSGRIFTPFSIGGFTLIPEDGTPPDNCGIPLLLGKKGAFGSGEHETTASCLEILESLPAIQGTHCLDLGSGTGILAIAAAKLGAARVSAVDIEWGAAISCAANASLNDVTDRICTICGELACIKEQSFDLILANIYADILFALAGEIVAMSRPEGLILLSGIPLYENFQMRLTYQRLGCELIDSRMMEEYATLLFRKS